MNAEPHPTSLDDVLEDLWRHLVRGAADRRHGFHLPVLATSNAAGDANARTVVLRSVDTGRRTISCHTDARSPKLDQLRARVRGAWVFYDSRSRIQVRASGRIEITDCVSDEAARVAWNRSSPSSRRCYLGPHPPSQPSPEPSANLPPELLGRAPTLDELKMGVENFRLLTTHVTDLDWLHLRHDGHRRASFFWDDSGRLRSTWLEP